MDKLVNYLPSNESPPFGKGRGGLVKEIRQFFLDVIEKKHLYLTDLCNYLT